MNLRRQAILCALLLLAPAAFAKDAYLAVAGSVGIFRTDARIFNPSQTKDIQVQAYFLPVGNGDNSGVAPITVTIAKRQMAVYNDIVASLFHASGLGGIRLSSADDFSVTERVYSTSTTACGSGPSPCTLGQGLTGMDLTEAKKNGVLIALSTGTQYLTNVVILNPNATAANILWRVYDKNNALMGQPKSMRVSPYGVVGPNAMTTLADVPTGADLTDAWIGYTSDQPIITWAGVNDRSSTDSTAIPAFNDPDPPAAPVTPAQKTYDVTVRSWAFDISPAITDLKVGDQITLRITAVDSGHGFKLVSPNGNVMVPDRGALPRNQTFVQTFTVNEQGSYAYICTMPSCGGGHPDMVGTFNVGPATPSKGGGY